MRVKSNSNRIGLIGKIKIGEKNQQGNPVSLDYFRATGKHEDEFKRKFGDKPQSIQIIFVNDESLDVRYELRQGKKLFAYSDGEMVFAFDKDRNEYVLQEKGFDVLGAKFSNKLEKNWEKVLRLYFIIPDLKIWGLWAFETKGVESTIPNIEGCYDYIKDRAGTVVNIPFDLVVEKVVSQKPESKNKFPVVNMVANLSDTSLERIKNLQLEGQHISGMITEEKLLIEAKNE